MSVVRARLLAMVKSGCTAPRVVVYFVCVLCTGTIPCAGVFLGSLDVVRMCPVAMEWSIDSTEMQCDMSSAIN